MDPELKALVDQLGRTFEEFKAANNQQIAELKKGVADVVTTDKLAKLDERLNTLQSKKDDLEKKQTERMDELEKKLNRPHLGGGDDADKSAAEVKSFNLARQSIELRGPGVDAEGVAAYRKSHEQYLRKGEKSFTEAEMKTMSVGGDPDGGYLVTPDTNGKIVTKLYETSPIRQIADVMSISTDAIEGVEDLGEAGAGYADERNTSGNTTTPQVGKWRIPVYWIDTEPKATQQLLDDAAVDVEGWLAGKVADKFGRFENNEFVNGATKIRGFCSYPTAATADSSRTWGTLEHVATGVNGDFAASNPADILYDVEGAMKTGYLGGATWVTRRTVVTKIRKFKGSDNNYLWQPGLQAGKPATLIGYPILMAEDMPALATGSLSMAFGNFRVGYQIVDRQGIRVLRDPYSAKPYVLFYTTKRVGGGVQDFNAIKLLKFEE